MPSKQAAVVIKKITESAVTRGLRELLKDYEQRAERYETSVAGSIRRQIRKAQEEDRYLTRFLVDPQDRRLVEYWDDDKMIKAFNGDFEEARKRRGKGKGPKEDKPLVKILPLIESLRAKRYAEITELFVWDCYVENDDMLALAGMLSRGPYRFQRIELIDCFLDTKSIATLGATTTLSRSLRELCLDYNDIGEKGCRALCTGLTKSQWLVHLSLCFCGLNKQCGLWLGNLIVDTAIRELMLDGNPLEAEGVIALLSQLSEAAENEGFERIEEIKRKEKVIEDSKHSARSDLNLDMASRTSGLFEDMKSVEKTPNGKRLPSLTNSLSPTEKNSSTKKKRGKRGKKGARPEPPPAGPQISVLHLADTGINHLGRGGNFAPVRCMQLLKSIISHSKDLQVVDLFANEVGDLGARQVLEGILARKEAKLPQIGVRMGHRINQDTFDIIHKLAPGPKRKKKKKKKK